MAERKVLIVDDDETLLPMLDTAFKRYKFAVFTTSDGKESLEIAKREHPDLILISVELPSGNGFLVCKEFKQDAKLKSTPIIITSRRATDADFEKHRKLKIRADDYLHKPFTDEELFQKVGNVVGFQISPDEYSELEAKVHDFLEERTKLESEINDKADRIAELEAQLAAVTKESSAFKKQLEEKDERIASLDKAASQAGEANEELKTAQAQIKDLEKQLSAKHAELEAAAKETTSAQKEVEKLQGAVKDTQESLEKAQADLDAARKEAKDAAKEAAKELESRVGELGAQLDDKSKALAAKEEEITRLEDENKATAERFAELENELDEAKSRATAVKEEFDALKAEVEGLEKEFGAELGALKETIRQWRDEAGRVPELDEAKSALEANLESLQSELKETQHNLGEAHKAAEKDAKKRQKVRDVLEKAMGVLD